MGESRRFHVALGACSYDLRHDCGSFREQISNGAAYTRTGSAVYDFCWFSPLYHFYLQSFCPPLSCAVEWQWFESVTTRPRFGISPSCSLSRIYRIFDGVLICYCRVDCREGRCCLGAFGAALDSRCLVIFNAWHRWRLMVGLLYARLGRLVVLGPC